MADIKFEEQKKADIDFEPVDFAEEKPIVKSKTPPAQMPKAGYDWRVFAQEALKRTGRFAQAAPAMMGAAAGAATGPLAPIAAPAFAGGAEAARQHLTRLFGGEAPQTGTEASRDILGAMTFGIPSIVASRFPQVAARTALGLKGIPESLTPAQEEARTAEVLNETRGKLGPVGVSQEQAQTVHEAQQAAKVNQTLQQTRAQLAGDLPKQEIIKGTKAAKDATEIVMNARTKAAYSPFDAAMEDPANSETVQMGTRKLQGAGGKPVTDAAGNPVEVPVTKDIIAPVATGPAKKALKPTLDEIRQEIQMGKATATPGYTALEQIDSMPEYVPAQTLENDLGGIKAAVRKDPAIRSRSKAVLNNVIDTLEKAIEEKVSNLPTGDVSDSLKAGRTASKAYHDLFDRPFTRGVRTSMATVAPEDIISGKAALAKADVLQQQTSGLTRGAMARSKFEDMVRQAQGDPEAFNTIWNKTDPELRAKIYAPRESAAIEKFAATPSPKKADVVADAIAPQLRSALARGKFEDLIKQATDIDGKFVPETFAKGWKKTLGMPIADKFTVGEKNAIGELAARRTPSVVEEAKSKAKEAMKKALIAGTGAAVGGYAVTRPAARALLGKLFE